MLPLYILRSALRSRELKCQTFRSNSSRKLWSRTRDGCKPNCKHCALARLPLKQIGTGSARNVAIKQISLIKCTHKAAFKTNWNWIASQRRQCVAQAMYTHNVLCTRVTVPYPQSSWGGVSPAPTEACSRFLGGGG
eukprot:3434843-Amphidinium_carterae.1